MTTIERTAAPTRAPVDSTRKTSLTAGVFYLITFAASIPALFLLGPVLNHTDYIVNAGADTSVLLGCFLDVVTALAGVGSAVALFSVVKRQHEGFALGFVTTRLLEAALIAIGVVSLLSVVTLRQHPAGADPSSLVAVGQSMVAVRNWTFLLGPNLMAALNAMLLGTLMYRSRLVPRLIPTIGLIGGVLLLAEQRRPDDHSANGAVRESLGERLKKQVLALPWAQAAHDPDGECARGCTPPRRWALDAVVSDRAGHRRGATLQRAERGARRF